MHVYTHTHTHTHNVMYYAYGKGRQFPGYFLIWRLSTQIRVMAEAEDSVRALADSFMAGWLALESRQSSSKKKDEIELVNRMVQLFSWYLILNQFKELESEWPCGGSEVQQSQYKTMWKQVLQGRLFNGGYSKLGTGWDVLMSIA